MPFWFYKILRFFWNSFTRKKHLLTRQLYEPLKRLLLEPNHYITLKTPIEIMKF